MVVLEVVLKILLLTLAVMVWAGGFRLLEKLHDEDKYSGLMVILTVLWAGLGLGLLYYLAIGLGFLGGGASDGNLYDL